MSMSLCFRLCVCVCMKLAQINHSTPNLITWNIWGNAVYKGLFGGGFQIGPSSDQRPQIWDEYLSSADMFRDNQAWSDNPPFGEAQQQELHVLTDSRPSRAWSCRYMIWCQKKSPHNKPRGGWVESEKIKKDGGEDHRQLNPVVLKDGGQRCCRLRSARPDPLRKVYDEERLKSCSCTHWGNCEDDMCINCVPLIMAAVSSSST